MLKASFLVQMMLMAMLQRKDPSKQFLEPSLLFSTKRQEMYVTVLASSFQKLFFTQPCLFHKKYSCIINIIRDLDIQYEQLKLAWYWYMQCYVFLMNEKCNKNLQTLYTSKFPLVVFNVSLAFNTKMRYKK